MSERVSERASFSLLCPLYSFFSSVSSFFLLSLLASLFSLFASLLSLLSVISSSFNLLFFFLGAYIASISKRHIRRSMVSHNCYTSSFLSFALSRLSSRFTLISCLCSFLCSLVALVAAFVSLLCLSDISCLRSSIFLLVATIAFIRKCYIRESQHSG